MVQLRRWLWPVALVVGAVVMTAAPASADHMDDHGTIVGGVGSEAEAVAYPCPKTPSGSYATTGPVVCVSKRASVWSLTWEHNGYSCSYGPGGWTGTCIFDNDMGDYIKVWGTRGIPDTSFTVRWGHATVPSEQEPTPGAGAAPPPGGGSGGSDGYSVPSGPTSPPPPPPPGSPGYPDYPSYTPVAPGMPGAPPPPSVVEAPDLSMPGIVGSGDAGLDAVLKGRRADALAGGADDGGSPWVAAAVAAALVAAAGGAVVVSRRRA